MNAKIPLALIVAHDQNRLIGRDGDLPWRLPNDLRHFKALTLGHTVLMGRKTWESLPRKPLPGRQNRVLTRDLNFVADGAEVVHTLGAALRVPAEGQLLVIGGAELYALTLPHAQRLYVTEVEFHDVAPPGAHRDTFFPSYDLADYRETACEAHPIDDTHPYAYRFVTRERRAGGHDAPLPV